MTPVLMIALEFGPVQTTGAFRSIDLARYLPEFGFEPRIVTIHPENGSEIFGAKQNETMLANLPSCVRIEYVKPSSPVLAESRLGKLVRILTTFDDTFYSRFQRSFESVVKDIRRTASVAAVYATAPPFGAARLGELASEMLDVPWVLDMRDSWSEWEIAPHPTYLHYRAKLRDEARAFTHASAVVATTEQMRDLFCGIHPGLPVSKFHFVPNGFNGPLFRGGALHAANCKETFDIAYVGNFYYTPLKPKSLRRPHSFLQYRRNQEDWSYRSPLYFLRAWRELSRTYPGVAKKIRFHHIGKTPAWLPKMVSMHALAQQSKFWGAVPKQEVSSILTQMDAQLATSMKRQNGGDYFLASKTFDYLMTEKPILAFVTDGSQRDFLEACGAALICNPDCPSSAANVMRRLVAGDVSLELNSHYVNQFHRREAARSLATILRGVLPECHSNKLAGSNF